MKRFLLAYLLLVLFVSAAHAQNGAMTPENCASSYDVPVNMIPRFDTPTYDYTQNIGALQTLAVDAKHSIHESLALGLTRYAPYLEINMPTKGIKLVNDTVCGHVEKVDVTLGYRDVVVYIAQEVAQGTCGFDEIMAHEQKHIAVNQRILDAYLPHIQALIENYVLIYGTFHSRHQEEVVAELRAGVQEIIDSEMRALQEDSRQLQAEVDSPEEYKRITYSCNGQLAHLSLKYLGSVTGFGSASR